MSDIGLIESVRSCWLIIEFPKLEILRKVNKIEDFEWKDVVLKDYDPMPNIKADMAI